MNENQEREYVLEREIEELKALLAARDAAIAALKQAVETKDRAHAAAIDREFAAIKRLELAEVVIVELRAALEAVGPRKQMNKPCFCKTAADIFCIGQPQGEQANAALTNTEHLAKGAKRHA